jgi:hypothetical protein
VIVGRCCGCGERIEQSDTYWVRYPHMYHQDCYAINGEAPHAHEGA